MEKIEVGDVILYKEVPMVVVACENYEDIGSCCYNRKYLFCNKSYIDEAEGLCSLSEIEKNGTWISVIGPKFPEIEKVKDCAPYEIKEIPSFKFRQKVAKTIVIYE